MLHEHTPIQTTDRHTDITSTDFRNTSKADATAGESVDPKVTFDLTVYTVLSAQPLLLTERGLNAEVSAEPLRKWTVLNLSP